MRFKRRKFADDPERVQALEARIAHLESMIEGLQDAVHRQSLNADTRMSEIERRLDPAEMSRALSQDARRRGL